MHVIHKFKRALFALICFQIKRTKQITSSSTNNSNNNNCNISNPEMIVPVNSAFKPGIHLVRNRARVFEHTHLNIILRCHRIGFRLVFGSTPQFRIKLRFNNGRCLHKKKTITTNPSKLFLHQCEKDVEANQEKNPKTTTRHNKQSKQNIQNSIVGVDEFPSNRWWMMWATLVF